MLVSDAHAELVGHLQSARTRMVKTTFMGSLLASEPKSSLTCPIDGVGWPARLCVHVT